MTISTRAIAITFGLSPGAAVGARTSAGVIVPGAIVETLARDFAFTEGPTCDAEGNAVFTGQPNDRIPKWSGDGVLSTFLQPAGRANGMDFTPGRDDRRPTSASAGRTGKRSSSRSAPACTRSGCA
jgi:sugar lactone lactonase YvrE